LKREGPAKYGAPREGLALLGQEKSEPTRKRGFRREERGSAKRRDAFEQLGCASGTHASGRELDRERHTRKVAHDLGDVGELAIARREGHSCANALDEEVDGIDVGHATELDDVLARKVERTSTRHDEAGVRAARTHASHPLAHDRCPLWEEMLEIVEDDERHGASDERPDPRGLCVDGRRRAPMAQGPQSDVRHLFRRVRIAHVAKPNTTEVGLVRRRIAKRQARLTNATRPDDRNETGTLERRMEALELRPTPYEPGGFRT
jgi:hypothetical protein